MRQRRGGEQRRESVGGLRYRNRQLLWIGTISAEIGTIKRAYRGSFIVSGVVAFKLNDAEKALGE